LKTDAALFACAENCCVRAARRVDTKAGALVHAQHEAAVTVGRGGLRAMERLQSAFLVDGFRYGEGPRWRDGKLWFVDNRGGHVHTVGKDGKLEVAVTTPHPSGLGWTPDGTLLISLMGQAKVVRVGPDGVDVLYDLSDRGWSCNDMVVGPDGRIYVNLYHEFKGDYPLGDVVLITPKGEIRAVATGLATPNGMAITPDRSTLVVSETFSGKILAYPILADGSLGAQRIFADLGPERRPDGICLDAEGAAWVGSAYTGEFFRVRDGGEITHLIKTPPGAMAIATCLGGEDLRTLYLVVNEVTPEGMRTGDSKGRIEYVRVEVPGAGWP
jgi:sugar lactone lactonase YvrE